MIRTTLEVREEQMFRRVVMWIGLKLAGGRVQVVGCGAQHTRRRSTVHALLNIFIILIKNTHYFERTSEHFLHAGRLNLT